MSPISTAHAELQIATAQAIVLAAQTCTRLAALAPARHPAELSDHRAAVAGDMADALNRIEPGLGTSWMAAMYPELRLDEEGV